MCSMMNQFGVCCVCGTLWRKIIRKIIFMYANASAHGPKCVSESDFECKVVLCRVPCKNSIKWDKQERISTQTQSSIVKLANQED